MPIEKVFQSLDLKHEINTTIIDDILWFNINKLTNEHPKTFILLLKDVIDYMRENKIKYVKQYIMTKETDFFKNSSIMNLNNGVSIVSTEITKFIDEIVFALGINPL